ncbi:hypothetical protein D3C81_2037430 [compost metagenome]
MDAGGQQGVEHLDVVRLAQEVVDMLGHHLPHVRHRQQLLHRGGTQGIQGEEVVGEVEGSRLPHLADAEGKQEAWQCGAARRIDGSHQVER